MTFPISICVPTYNRCTYLNELIESIVCDPNYSQIELCISDNASADGTAEMVAGWADQLTVRYHRFDENQGADANYLNVVSMATGDYVWIIGSDDQVVDGGISTVLAHLTAHPNTGVVLFGRDEYDHSMTQFLNRTHWVGQPRYHLDIFDFRLPESRTAYFRQVSELGGLFSYISSIVIKRELWQTQVIDPQFMGTAYSHVYMILKGLLCSSHSLLFLSPEVPIKARLGNDSFFQTNCQRLMLDIDGYLLLATALIPAEERSAFYSPLRSEGYLDYLNNTLRAYYPTFSGEDLRKIITVCGWAAVRKCTGPALKIGLRSLLTR
ncbi:glycosyltransferase family 2 protein [bacterium]|nr:glycosyltransferase family 2 protein [bacterium]